MIMGETVPLSQVKARFSEVVDRVVRTGSRVVVTRNARPPAVLMTPDDLEARGDGVDPLRP